MQKLCYLTKHHVGKEVWEGTANTCRLRCIETIVNATSQRLWVFHIVRTDWDLPQTGDRQAGLV
jgi:hypothetical protein